MKKIALMLSVALATFCSLVAQAAIDFSGVTALADRLGGTALTSKVSFTEWTGETGDKAQIVPNGDTFTIKATSVRAASYALGKYLRDVAKGHVSWCGNRVPQDWAIPTETIDATPAYEFTVAYNYCTLAYTMAFWGENEWRQEIDRLALLGFNVALVEAGLPRVWQLTLAEMGFSDEQIKKFIPDEAAQPWWNMGNLEGLGGPLSDARIAADADLGKFIATEMRKVGIEPILQGFVGLVPTFSAQVLDSTYSGTDGYEYVDQGDWCRGVKRPILLSPLSQAYRDFAAKWYKNLKAVYGFEPKYLGGDLFHEGGTPGSLNVPACAKAVQDIHQEVFPGVTWVLQSWQGSPEQGVQNGVDPRYTLVEALDMNMSNTGAFSTGYKRNYKNQTTGEYLPWVWVEVMNFGGNTGMYGGMNRYSNIGTVSTASGIDAGSTAVFKGYGNLSEGFETNPTVYDLYMSAFMRDKSAAALAEADRPAWFRAYQERRWGYTDDTLVAAYGTLATTVWQSHTYNVGNQQGVIENILCASPSFGAKNVSQWGPAYTTLPYEPTDLMPVAQTFIETMEAHPELLELETFRYDMVEFFAQLLADRARVILKDCVSSGSKRAEFLKLIDLSEKILACSNGFRLDAKENRTKSVAGDAGVAAYRRMVTTWMGSYQRGQDTQLHEYAHRAYAGLMKDYYKKRWEAFFKSQTGEITSAAYVNTLKALDDTFPTATLTPTANGNLKEIAAEIVDFLTPQSLTWNGASDNTFEGANWTNAKGETVAWEDDKSVVLTGVNKTIAAQNPVTIGNVELTTDMTTAANVYGGTNGGYITTDTDLGWTNLTLDELASAKYTGIMSGAWMGGAKLDCSAYHVKKDGDSVTMQFQVVHDSQGVFTKVVAVKLSINDAGRVIANYLWANNGAADAIGREFKQTDTPASGTLDGYQGEDPTYGMIGISRYPASSVTVTGPVSITGEVTLNLGEAVSFPGATMIDTMGLKNGNATLVLGANQELTINGVNALNGSKLVLKGTAATLQGASGAAKVKFPKAALANVVYVGPDGEEQALKLDAEGYAKMKLGALSYDAFVTATATKTAWKNVTLDDLAACEFTGAMGGKWLKDGSGARGYQIEKTADAVTFLMQKYDTDGHTKSVKITLTIGADDFVYIKASEPKYTPSANVPGMIPTTAAWLNALAESATAEGYGVASVAVKPAVATVAGILSNYSVLTDAITAANGAQKVTLLDDATVTASIKNNFKTWIEIPRGITLTATCGDFIYWERAYTLDIYGTLDLGGNALSVGTTNGHLINLYAGGEIKSTSAKGLAIFNANTTITVKTNDGFEKAVLNTSVQARENTTIAVEEGVTAVLNGGIALKAAGESGVANPVVTKTGAGALEFNGAVADGASLVHTEGTLTFAMAPSEVRVVTVANAQAVVDYSSTDEDYEIIDTAEGNVHTYTSTAIPWVAGVGEERVDTGWVKYRTYKEALAVVKEGQCVYVLDETCIPEGTEITSGPAGSYLTIKEGYMVDAEGNVIVIPRTFNLSAFGIDWWDTDDSGSIYVGPAAKGGDAKWDVAANWMKTTKDGVGDRRTGGANDYAPYALGNPYNYALIDGDNIENVTPDGEGVYHLTADKLDFWRVRLGLTNNVDVTITEVTKMQKGASAFIYVDPTSKLTIKKVTNNKGEEIDLHSAAPEGIVFEGMNGNVWNFYLEGEGTVQFNCQLSGSSHKIKSAEIEIGEGDFTQFKTKKLVGFTSLASGAAVTLAENALVDVTGSDVTLTAVDTITADSPAGSYKLRTGTDGFYLDYIAKSETRPLLVWNTTNKEWIATTVATIEGTSFTKVPTADDTVVFTETFTTLGSSVLYIWPNQTTKNALTACRKFIVRDGVTLHLGFAESTCNIPNDFTITLEGSAKLVLSRWNSTTKAAGALGDNITINGGSVEIDTDRVSALTIGNLVGTTTFKIPANFTVTAQGDVGVTLSGAGTLKAGNLGTIQADAEWTGTVDTSAVAVRGINTAAGAVITENPDGTKTIEIVEIPNELYMTAGPNLSEGTFTNALGTTVAYATFNTWQRKPKIVLNDNYGIRYFGDTTGYNFAVRDTDIYAMITGSTLAFGDSMIEVQSGTLHLITSEGLRNGSGWNPKVLNLGSTDIIVGDSAHVAFAGTTPADDATIVVGYGKTLTMGGNLNNISFTNIRFNSPNGKLMLSGGIGTIELVGENIIKDVEIDKTMTLKLNGTASLKTTSAGLKIATDSTTQFVKATLADGQYTYALADAKGAVSFNERENVYNFAAPQFAIANAAASSTVTVTIKNDQGATVLSQEATVGADGTVDILVGSAEDPQKPGLDVGKEYTYEVTVGGQTFNGNFYTMNLPTWFKADATSGESVVSGGSWDVETAPAVDTVAKVYTLDGESTFSVSGDKGASKLSYVKQKVTFTSAIEVGDLTPDILGSDTPTGAITIANDGGSTLVWYAYIGGEWKALYDTAAPQLNTEYTIRADVDRAANPKTISYVVNGRHLKDKDDNTVWNLADGAALTKVVFKGSGKLAMVEGVVPSTAVAKVGTTEYDSLEAALKDPNYGEPGDAAGGDAPRYGVELLTSVLWAPKVGTYYITKGVYDIKVVNEKLISWNDAGTVATVAVNEAPIEGFVAPVEGGSTTPVGISGEWLNKLGTDGLTKKEIQAKLNETQKGAEMTNLEAYLLGVDAGDVATTKVTTTAVQNDDPKAITLALDGIRPRDRAETGVTVKVQVMAADDPTEQFSEQGEAVDGASATIDLPSTKVKYYRLKVKFE